VNSDVHRLSHCASLDEKEKKSMRLLEVGEFLLIIGALCLYIGGGFALLVRVIERRWMKAIPANQAKDAGRIICRIHGDLVFPGCKECERGLACGKPDEIKGRRS